MTTTRVVRTTAFLMVVLGGCSGDGMEPEPEPRVHAVIRGRVHTPDGGDVSSLWAVWQPADGARADSSRVGAAGGFQVEVTTSATSGELRVGGASGAPYHPFLYPFEVGELADLDAVLVPLTWTVLQGEYQGQTVPTGLDPVVEDNADQLLYSYFNGQPWPRNAPESYLLDLKTWPAEGMPARVAIDHANAERDVTASDSARLWGVLDRMEAVFGLDLFEPVVADPTWWPVPTGPFDAERIPGVIRMTFQAPGWRAVLPPSGDAAVWEENLGAWAGGGRFQAFRVSESYLDSGSLVVGAFEPLQLADGLIPWETVMTHEMLHVLGVGHTCRIASPMGPCQRTAEASPTDVAYMELLREVIRLQRELDTPFGIMPAVIGERRILLGLPALPEVREYLPRARD